MPAYRGRFAPSPTGPLHAGSVVAALASWLDARAHGGRWLVRIEDTDTPRCGAGVDRLILGQLSALGLQADEPPLWQSRRAAAYEAALQQLRAAGRAYPCGCTRSDIEAAAPAAHERHAERIYPGTCKHGLHGRPARAWRFDCGSDDDGSDCVGGLAWRDRRLGLQRQRVAAEVGDFVLRRADGLWAYQLAVVVDDAAQGISHVVRGHDLADNTPRQILLQRALGVPTPAYLHTPLVLAADGSKLSKQNGASALDVTHPLMALRRAGNVLGLPPLDASDVAGWLAAAVTAWAGMIAGFANEESA